MAEDPVDPLTILSDEVQRLAGMGFWEHDVLADQITWSKNLGRLYGLPDAGPSLPLAEVFQFVHPDDHEGLLDTFTQAVEHQRDWAHDHRLIRKDGEVRWVQSRGHVVVRDGAVVGLVGTTTDITERKATEENLRRFVADASHELRTPATAILNAVDLLHHGKVRPEQTASIIDVLRRQAERLLALTDTVLDLSRLTDAPQRAMLERVDVADALQRAVAAFEAAGGSSPDVVTDVDGQPVALAVPVDLERVLVNLIQNGLRHGAAPVTVTAHVNGSEVLIAVEDSGPGVAPDLRSELFTPFARSESGGGTGLGLPMVRAMLRTMGGAISHEPTPGTPGRFVVRLGRGT